MKKSGMVSLFRFLHFNIFTLFFSNSNVTIVDVKSGLIAIVSVRSDNASRP
jgi:hypothetical protein